MKRIFSVFAGLLLLAGCKKDDSCGYADVITTATPSEIAAIQSYLSTNSLTAIQHSSGVFYTVDVAGDSTGITSLCNMITVTYAAYRFGVASPFDSYTAPGGRKFLLGQLILGVQKALPAIKAKGTITLYIPPSLAYGQQDVTDPVTGAVILPANSYIIFQMSLLGVN